MRSNILFTAVFSCVAICFFIYAHHSSKTTVLNLTASIAKINQDLLKVSETVSVLQDRQKVTQSPTLEQVVLPRKFFVIMLVEMDGKIIDATESLEQVGGKKFTHISEFMSPNMWKLHKTAMNRAGDTHSILCNRPVRIFDKNVLLSVRFLSDQRQFLITMKET